METDMTGSKHEYTAEFKEEAVRLVISSQKSCAEIARNLGIPPYLVVRCAPSNGAI
jgi:transposase